MTTCSPKGEVMTYPQQPIINLFHPILLCWVDGCVFAPTVPRHFGETATKYYYPAE